MGGMVLNRLAGRQYITYMFGAMLILGGLLGVPGAYAQESGSDAPQIKLGQDLFQGRVRFENGGPSCISCHSAHYGDTISGGVLAKDLTTAFSRLGEPGIRMILGALPFPLMQAAYKGRSFTDSEIRAVTAFLQQVDKRTELHQAREYAWAMFGAGIGGVAVWAGVYSVIWRRRKSRSVNQDIYDRQVKSE